MPRLRNVIAALRLRPVSSIPFGMPVVPAVFVLILHQVLLMGAGILGATQNQRSCRGEHGYWQSAPVLPLLLARTLVLAGLFLLPVSYFLGFCFDHYGIARTAVPGELWLFTLPFLLATPVLFGAGAALAYFVVMPVAFTFFLNFGGMTGGLNVQALPSAGDYLSLVMQFILAFGLTFLLPVLLLLLHRAGIVSRAQMVAARRYVIVVIFVIAAVVTPPDPGSQIILAVPLWLLFEAALLLMRFQEKAVEADRAARKAEEAAEQQAAAE